MPSSSEREAFWRNPLTRRDTLRLTVGEACEQLGVSPASFYQWQRKLRESERRPDRAAAPSTPLVPVRIVNDRIVNDRVVELTLELPHGLRLRLPGRLRRDDARACLAGVSVVETTSLPTVIA
jgi:transposase-like protein